MIILIKWRLYEIGESEVSKVDEDISNEVSDVPPKKRKTKEDKELEEVEVESTGGGFDAGGG